MHYIYTDLRHSFSITGYETDWLILADKHLASFKEVCPTQEALSVADIENGNLLRKVRAHWEKVLKSATHLDEYGNALPKKSPGGFIGSIGGMAR
jgi:hypothetical protein